MAGLSSFCHLQLVSVRCLGSPCRRACYLNTGLTRRGRDISCRLKLCLSCMIARGRVCRRSAACNWCLNGVSTRLVARACCQKRLISSWVRRGHLVSTPGTLLMHESARPWLLLFHRPRLVSELALLLSEATWARHVGTTLAPQLPRSERG